MTDVSPLFRPFKLRGMELKNRIAMAPMTRGQSPGGIPTPENAAYYRRRAAAEVGLIISEGTLTRRKGAADNAAYPLFWGEEALAGWKRTIDGVHAAGGKMAPQIWHQGMSRKPGTGHFPDAPCDGPSGITLTGKKISDEPSEADVIDMAQAYADAAADAKAPRLRLHRAARRPRLPDRRVLLARHQPAHRPLRRRHDRTAFRVRPRSHPPLPRRHWRPADDHPRLAMEVGRLQRQARHHARRNSKPGPASSSTLASTPSTARSAASSNRNSPRSMAPTASTFAGWVKKLTGIPTISVGSVGLSSEFTASFRGEGSAAGKLDETLERLDRGEFDLVAVGRALLQDPEWAVKVKSGRFSELRDYDGAAIKTYY